MGRLIPKVPKAKILTLFMLSVFVTMQNGTSAWADDSSDSSSNSSTIQSLITQGIHYFNPGTSTSSCGNDGSAGTVTLTGSDNGQKMWNFFLGQGFTTNQVAAIMGNLYAQDTTFNPEQVEIPPGGNSTTPTTQEDLGWGLAQWTPTSGPNPIFADAQTAGVSSDQLDTLAGQLTIIMSELNNSSPTDAKDMIKPFEQITDLTDATNYFYQYFEGGGAAAPSTVDNYAAQMLQQYNTGTSSVAGSGSGSTTSSSGNGCSVPNVNCNGASVDSSLSSTRQNVVCIAQQQLALWKSQSGYPWDGENSYSETGYLNYSENRKEEWCADFATWVYSQANDPLHYPSDSSSWNIAYVPNIQTVGQANGSFHWHPESSGYIPKPGDLAIHGADHVNIFISSSGSTAEYIGGDQGQGPYPGGSIVSIETGNGYYDNGITGYVSPD